ncbi:MAG: OPT family oligopeptide transporter [Mycoplasmatales bacterium]
MRKKNQLPHEAYGGVEGSKYIPFISDRTGIKEMSIVTIIIGILLAILFGASNTYSGLLSGLTVAAGIPGAILGGGALALIAGKKNSILNNNIVQGMSAGGESVASGMIFVLPAVFIIGQDVTFLQGVIAGIAGSILGLAISSIVHNYLIVEEHGTLIYPESMAISETLVTTTGGGDGIKIMGLGFLIAGLVTAVSYQMFNLFNNTFSLEGSNIKWGFDMEASPLLLGIGFIVGMEVSMAMFAGSVLAYFVVIPAMGAFTVLADPTATVWNDPELLIREMTTADIRGSYAKYIGAGTMLAGGFIGAIKLIPTIKSSLAATFSGMKSSGSDASDSKTSMLLTFVGIILVLVVSAILSGSIAMAAIAGILAIFFVIIFSIVAGKMVGDIGTSNLPVSGMTIASLLIITLTFLFLGWTTPEDNATILLITTVIVVAISVSAGYTQSQKVTYIVGGSKGAMQKSFIISSIVGVITVTAVILVLKEGILSGSFDAPQANLMASLTDGVLTGQLPWSMIFIGVGLAFVLHFLKLPIMTIAIGFYLPIATTSIILVGAILRTIVEKIYSKNKELRDEKINKGIILSSGLVAGGAIVGLIGAAFAMTGNALAIGYAADSFASSNGAALITVGFIIVSILAVIMTGSKKDAK